MNRNEVIKYPILTEKTYAQMGNGIYTFAVDRRTNKVEVKKTVEFIFGVKVARVNIANVAKKPTKLGRFAGFTTSYKRAVITLKEGQINIFPDEAVAQEAPKAEIKETKNEKPSEAELKAAAKIQAKAKAKEAKAKETPVKAEK
ncbi:50S ribosomal protein L23 [Mycoplasma marinum]|uniref:Large ribosomal subunit protein uL23 n=1 Tax=Mycoplasma marinum TaxID=1937190 RepID=A0A4R0XKG6_9MOLU|nr:50S ribosomal protein L23 [Mycoplasma marinum]TCG11146.1 50S ribosomal protein L23 [Mycoplasma marinum]